MRHRAPLSDDFTIPPFGPVDLSPAFGRVLGTSPAMQRLFDAVRRLSASEATVLLEGETGTGKGLLAEAIHAASPRAAGPFVQVDCGAISRSLIESELFGHERGAFTGAINARVGALASAQGGTVFLDEIGELPLELQPVLLRAIEQRVVKPVGGNDLVPLDVRVIAATNRDLAREVERGTFRSDLYFRLNIVRFHIPALRERREDVAMLAAHFYRALTGGKEPPAELVASLAAHDWPGNVRELKNAVERTVLLGTSAFLPPEARRPTTSDTEELHDPSFSFGEAKRIGVERWERAYVRALLGRHRGNVTAAARAARMDRNHLRRLARRYRPADGEGVR
jgi:DNA-binding NtrC family response regulator